MDTLAVVVPCYNEEEMLPLTTKELTSMLGRLIEKGKIADNSFVLYIDDGSKDKTWELIETYSAENAFVKGIKLAGNVGHQYALAAGMLFAMDKCDMLISIDADLQDDIFVMGEMIDKYHEGCDIVYGVRNDRKKDTLFKRATAQTFYKLMGALGVKTVYNHADYRLMSKRAVEQFSRYGEVNLYIRGIVPMLGYKTDYVYYERKERVAGESKYPLGKMMSLAWNGITSFSVKPINFVTGMGLAIVTGHVVKGWTSLIISIWFLGGLQLFAIGLVGQYIGKIYLEVKHRPRYQIETGVGFEEE